MALLEQYPEWAMRTNAQNERETRPWVSGISPLASGLMAAGFGMMGDGASEWVGGGGTNWDAIGRGGLLGLQAYQKANRDLQDQRSTFFDQRRLEEAHAMDTNKFQTGKMDREEKIRKFPELIEQLNALNEPSINPRIKALLVLGEGDIDTAYNAASNLLSTATKPRLGKIKTRDNIVYQEILDNNGKVISEQFKQIVTTPTAKKLSAFDKLSNALSGEVPLPPQVYQLNREAFLAKNTKFPKRMVGAEEQILSVQPDVKILDVFEYIKRHRPELALNEDGSEKTRAELIKEYNIREPKGRIEEVTSGPKKAGAEQIRDMMKVFSIKSADKFLEKIQETYDPTTLNPASLMAYLQGTGLKFTSEDAKSYEDTALVGARMLGYLMSGATVKDEEMQAMRVNFYPVWADSAKDIERKKLLRQTMVNLFISQLPKNLQLQIQHKMELIENSPGMKKEVAKIKLNQPPETSGKVNQQSTETVVSDNKTIINKYLP